MSSAKTLFALASLASVCCSPATAAAISNVTFLGNAQNPTVTISGSGFLPAPAPSAVATPGFTGQDYGAELHITDGTNNPNTFDAGFNNPTAGLRDVVGLAHVTFTDTSITFQFGSEYAFYGPSMFLLNTGDAYTVFVHSATFNGTVAYAAAVTTPEPVPAGLLLAGLAAFTLAYKRRART